MARDSKSRVRSKLTLSGRLSDNQSD
ncbi:hypothetical protein AGR6A_Cc60405 [Agrobacterium sp. NCPPB 925]|nr:hypothetical protein AGR6A_Cc60405 [Agrobacterium sp. NCPPB 925]